MALAPGLLATLIAYRNAPKTFFAQDDITFLSRAAGIAHSISLVRPLSETLAFRIQYAFFGLEPFGYHVTNLVLHVINVVGVYALGICLKLDRQTAGAAALLFGVSAIAFTPLHWATGIIELLTGTLLLAATLIYLLGRQRRRTLWLWTAAGFAFLAALSKEVAVGWLLAIGMIEWRSGLFRREWKAWVPPVAVTTGFLLWFLSTSQMERVTTSEVYAPTHSVTLISHNLMTYLRWCVALHEPIRDVVAAIDSGAWRIGLIVLLAISSGVWLQRRCSRHPIEIGVTWMFAFLIPVLALAHHSYLYYLYIPWIGGALALACAGRMALRRLSPRSATWVGIAMLASFFVIEASNVAKREVLTRDYLPVDRTMRDAMLLNNSLPTLQTAALPAGTPVAFVNPVPRRRFDLMTGAPTQPADFGKRRSYMPLEAAMRGGETFRLFLPTLEYRGFATTIPHGWEDAESFLYEQRGWLESWGRGQAALSRQAELQLQAAQWAAADSTWRRVRAFGDTLPDAVWGQHEALTRLGRREEAAALADSFISRWPMDSRVRSLRGPNQE